METYPTNIDVGSESLSVRAGCGRNTENDPNRPIGVQPQLNPSSHQKCGAVGLLDARSSSILDDLRRVAEEKGVEQMGHSIILGIRCRGIDSELACLLGSSTVGAGSLV